MSKRSDSRPLWILIGLVILGGAAIFWIARGPAAPEAPPPQAGLEPPLPDYTEMQAPVVRRIEQARQAVIDRPSVDSWGHLGKVCDAHQLYDCAEVAYRQAWSLESDNFIWVYLLAVVQDFRGAELEEIQELFGAAMSMSAYPPGNLRFGDALFRRGDLDGARDAYTAALAEDPNFGMAHRGLGQVLLNQGDAAGALVHLEFSAQALPQDSISQSGLAQAYAALGREDEAALAAQAAGEMTPNHSIPDPIRYEMEQLSVAARTLIPRYQAKMSQGAYAAAVEDLQLLVESFPDQAIYRVHLGICQAQTGQTNMARAQMRRALELDPELVDAHLHLGELAESDRDFKAAAEHYRRAAEMRPDNAVILTRLAAAVGRGGDLESAAEQFRRASEMAPSNSFVPHMWGVTLMRGGDYPAAAERFRAALQLQPRSVDSLYHLGFVLEFMGEESEARSLYRQVLELAPNHPRAGGRLADLESAG